jgi:hypothetical protein
VRAARQRLLWEDGAQAIDGFTFKGEDHTALATAAVSALRG